jgi:hypothetical protein
MAASFMHEATEMDVELKRADFLIQSSLKYARTADVVRNVIKRIVSAYEAGINLLCTKLDGPPSSSFESKIKFLENRCPCVFETFFKEYLKLSELQNLISVENEYKATVRAIFKTKKGPVSISIDDVNNMYEVANKFRELVLLHMAR